MLFSFMDSPKITPLSKYKLPKLGKDIINKQLDSELSMYGEIENISIQFISRNFYSSFIRYKT